MRLEVVLLARCATRLFPSFSFSMSISSGFTFTVSVGVVNGRSS
jgi:hypothetical protein